MAGAISGGMVSAVQCCGLTQVFDIAIGTSVGAFAGAFLLADQADLGTSIFYEDINNAKFLNVFAPIFGRPMMDLDFLCYDVMNNAKRFDFERFINSGIPLVITMTNANTGELTLAENFETRDQLLNALRATCTIPLIAGGPFKIDHGQYFDGGLVAQFPMNVAAERGYTHQLVLACRRVDQTERHNNLADMIAVSYLRSEFPAAAKAILTRKAGISAVMKELLSNYQSKKTPNILPVFLPKNACRPGRLTKNGALLQLSAIDGMKACLSALGVDDQEPYRALGLKRVNVLANQLPAMEVRDRQD
jgi:predicted patatin/cPLA2 family phospholipase